MRHTFFCVLSEKVERMENEIQSANEVKVVSQSIVLRMCALPLKVVTAAAYICLVRMLWRSRSSLTGRAIRNRSAA